MKSSPRIAVELSLLSLFAGLPFSTPARAQTPPKVLVSAGNPVIVRSVRGLADRDGSAVEIISDRPLVPAISRLDDPPRLVIDLPNARLSDNKKRVAFRSSEIRGVRVNQFQETVARIVLDLAQPVKYTWDAAGNRLMVRLHTSQEASERATIPAFTSAAQVAVTSQNSAASGAVILAGNRISAGSSVTAGADTAILRLGRGGEVRVCPGTTVSVTSSQNGRSLMLGMSTGTLEAHYALNAEADTILTPDFRILLAGPGEFHYGISADSRGNTCVRALPGNSASVIVSELLGDGSYQVKPAEQIVFWSGRLNAADKSVPASCGCPTTVVPIMRAATSPRSPSGGAGLSSQLPESGEARLLAEEHTSANAPRSQFRSVPDGPETAALPPPKAGEVHVQVEAPFVFRANEPTAPAAAPTREASLLSLRYRPHPVLMQIAALPPPHGKSHGVLGKIKSFFVAIFS